jgi:hypothetical protein
MNTFNQSGGSPTGGGYSFAAGKAVSSPDGGLYDATGKSSNYDQGGDITFNPRTAFETRDPAVNMPTGAKDPGGFSFPEYQVEGYQQAGPYFQLGGGDYNRLEDSIVASRMAPLDYAQGKERERTDAELNKRGIFNSGAAVQAQGDVTDRFLPQYTQAGAEAATQRYGLEANDLSGLNQFRANDANAYNAYNLTNADKRYTANKNNLDYLARLWEGTGGQTSGSSGFGQSVNIG